MTAKQSESAKVIAVAGGKGGTGKTLLAANIGIFLATLGKRVTLLDAAFGSANLHSFVGVARPQRTLADCLGNNSVPLDHVVVETRIPGLGLIAGEGDPAWAGNPKSVQVQKLITRLKQLPGDYVVIDLGAGTGGTILDLFSLADVGILVAIPEPTSVELTYRFLRAAFVRRLRKLGIAATDVPAEELRLYEGGIPAPSDIYARIAGAGDQETAARVAAEMAAMRPRFVVNNVRSKADQELGADLSRAVRRRLSLPAEYLGPLEYDDAVWVAVRRRQPLLIEHPESRIARCIERVVRRLLSKDKDRPIALEQAETYYDLLDLDPAAADEDIRRANRRIREVYGKDSVVVGGLYDRDRLEVLHQQIDEAYETLMDPLRRKAYDQVLFPGGVPPRRTREDSELTPVAGIEAIERRPPREDTTPPMPRPNRPNLAADTVFTGALIKEVRESMGIELRAVAEETKIGMGYLRAIEEENFKKLPAVVYVRGFLVQYGRVLQLDVDRVLATYLERYKEAREVEPEPEP